jgi:GNAT superfamily N-acetyltransferase
MGHLYFIYDQDSERYIVDEPEEYVRPISGYVEFLIGDGHDNAHEGKQERRTVAGRFDASYINVDNCLVAGVKLYGLMDTYSAEMAEVYETLFDSRTDELRRDVKELLGNVPFRNILVIDRVEILPAYRGMGIGLSTLLDIIQRHSAGCGIVALKAFPFQFRSGSRSGRLGFLEESDWNKKMGYDTHSYTMEYAHEKLIFHLTKFGFKRIGDRGVLALSTSMKNSIPQEIERWFPRSVIPKPEQL